ncbi:hypothetical protein [Pseudalkalibacillus caeni]|uniref:NERD domain-containing protein n=1 Tax=Exobacillus caeni TaxID=2574798 RepID=A0A5R9F1A7_9BACL|nr:hypothetical protein [Pseudalkalibacillus caeni]TLS36791.1 hypothetical protein FCL54_12600 [Pseudalkalibacillus caeni]
MSVSVYDKLEAKIYKLKDILSEIDTENLLGLVATEFGITLDTSESIFKKTQLKSPFKQYLYLIGLMLSTKDNCKSSKNNPPMEKIKTLLNEITDYYVELFLPVEGQEVDERWLASRKISMPVFLNYFNTNSLTYEEQVIERIRNWFTPFDKYIKEQIGISVNELICIFTFIRDNLQKRFDEVQVLQGKMYEEREHFFEYMRKKKVSFEQAKKELHLPNTIKLGEEFQLIHQIKIEDLKIEFGESVAKSFVSVFSRIREESDFFYYTEPNPFEASPIWRKSDEILFVPMYKQIIHAIHIQLTELLENSEHRTKFYKNRDKKSEDKTLEIFQGLFKDSATYYTSVFENNKSHNEHDILIKYGETLFIVEVKASKVKEPFRNPEKAYKRIKRDFKSDGGIQKGYDQGLNLKNLILQNEETTLYDSKGTELVKLEKDKIQKVFIIVVTAEDMGILSTNLSYLLEKPEEEPYAWACNLYDLETALDGLVYTQGTISTFIQYLEEREEYHEYLLASDELEILGYFLENRSLQALNANKDKMVGFAPDFSTIFDDIYFEKRGISRKQSNQELRPAIYKSTKKVTNKGTKKKKRKQSRDSKKKNRKKKK